MKVSIITPNYNGFKFLEGFFNSLLIEKDYINEIIIVDNGSTDKSIEYINDLSSNYPINIKLIKNTKNLGFASAINQGIKLSKSEYVYLLNNDVEITKDSIKNLLLTINSYDNIFSVSSKMLQFYNRNLIDDAGDEYTILAYTKKSGNNQDISNYTKTREIFSSCAGAALYKKSIIEELGYFDNNFFAYMEDVDLGYRAQINGYKNYFSPDSIVYHIGSGTTGSKYNEFKIKIAARNNIWLIYKNFPIPQKIINFIFLLIGFGIKYLYFKKKGFGDIYISGIKEGLNSRNKLEKTKFNIKNWKNYFKIEWKLLKNTFLLFKK
ncbi:glycosyl transferase family 2 [Methanobrevibacter sp. 87.7]|uniref:glycosyltransferase family 2 protein n=1 Tax=Methanobrevibacter sp. 87.7 TaxID=387957 RepID=UPI000B502476|nr:glycosyltransferase family 2 protein [Methanobrevibacter sp. 87.7]OWT33404.1 glycosyl transferase family 2 [Methanobrevibacter sp. 87.7]